MTINYIKLIILCILSIGLSACSEEEPDNLNGNGKQVTISLSIPDMGKSIPPMTYAMPVDENKINTIDVLVFKTDPLFPNDPSKGTYFYRAAVTHTAGSTTFTARFIEAPDNQTIVVLANCRTEVTNLLSTIITRGDSKAEVIKALSLTQSTSFDPVNMTGMPMWGEITNQYITPSYNPTGLSVKLTRMLAKINIVNNDTSNFTLQEAYLYNPRQKGSIIPNNWNENNSSVTIPTIIDGTEMAQGSKFAFLTTSGANKIENRVYTFEANNEAMAAGDRLDATCLVVGGIYQGGSSKVYYRIDLKNYENDEFFNVLRNHSYNITITSVTDEGIATPDEAYKGFSRIKADVEVWNEATGEVTYIGSDHLHVSKHYVWVNMDGTRFANNESEFSLKYSVDGYDGMNWRWFKSQPAWAEITASSTTSDHYYTFFVTATDITTSEPNGREGKIVIEGNYVEYIVHVMQGNCGRNGIPLVQTIGNYTYKTHQYPTGANGAMECWMVENSIEGLIGVGKGYGLDWSGASIGSIINDSRPSYRGNVNGYYYTWEQRENACPKGWVVPTQSQWQSLQTHINNGLESNEAIWWAGSRGAENNAFAGDCGLSDKWYSWNIDGVWWSSAAHQAYRGHEIGMHALQATGEWPTLAKSIRCVRE